MFTGLLNPCKQNQGTSCLHNKEVLALYPAVNSTTDTQILVDH